MPALKTTTKTKNINTETITTPIATVTPKPVKGKGAKGKVETKVSVNLTEVAAAYSGILKGAEANLLIMRDIGLVLISMRVDYKSDQLFGKFIDTTELKIMSRQDRYDAQWIAVNWSDVQQFKTEQDCASNSVGVLRKKLTEFTQGPLDKAAKEAKKVKAAKAKAAKDAKDKKEPSEGAKLDLVQLTEYILELIAENGLKTKDIIHALQSTIK